jgi:dTDP-4-dehydrorhamnose reductase
VGLSYQKLLTHKNIPFKNLVRSDLDYTDVATLIGALEADQPEFLINAAGYTGKPNVDACEADKANCLFGNAILPGRIAEACEATNTPWGHVSSGCIYTGAREDGTEFTEEDAPNFTFRQNNCSFYSGIKALGEEILSGAKNVYIWRLRIPFDENESPRNYLTKLMRYQKLLQAENSISQLHEFVASTFACWEKQISYGTYNVTNPGYVSTSEVVDLILESGICQKEYEFFSDEAEFMGKAAIAPRSNCIMSSAKLVGAGIEMTPAKEAIQNALNNWKPSS